MKIGLYAGSFDPWSIGHQYVLENAADVFDAMHVVVAVHPSKKSRLDAEDRARLVAHMSDPTQDWWSHDSKEPLLVKNKNLTVSISDGLVAEYAQAHNIKHLVRGMRSTTDFEAEFNLYFANNAIAPELQTWAIMCPPKLLHCSSTYIRAVVGRPSVKFMGTSFAAQALMLDKPVILGQLFDLLYESLDINKTQNLTNESLLSLQDTFTKIINDENLIDKLNVSELNSNVFTKNNKCQTTETYLNLLNAVGIQVVI